MILNTPLEHLHAIELPTPFPVGPITVYVANAPDEPLTLVDTGPHTEDAWATLGRGLAQLGHTPADLDRIIITHAHVDHFGLAARLVGISGAEVLTHRQNVQALEDFFGDRARRTSFFAGLLREASVPANLIAVIDEATRSLRRFARSVAVDTPLVEGHRLSLAGYDWQMLHTPGHAGGLVCLYEHESGTLLSSDHLLADISSNPVVEPPPPGEYQRPKSLILYVASLQRVAALPISRALPGHGPVIHDVPGLVSQRLTFHQKRKARILDALYNGAHTTWDITQAIFPHRSPLDTFLAVSETIGHLDLLETEGKIVPRRRNGVILWRALEGQSR